MALEKRPLVSVIMCVFNGEDFLREAIASLAAQTYRRLEIVFVDDGSTDGTAAIATAGPGPIRYTHQENQGLPAARNTGVGLARGDFITFLDADDWWAADKTERQVALLESNPEVDIVLGHTRRTWMTDDAHAVETEPELALSLCAGLIRRSVFDRVGTFDQTLRHCDDWDWFMRAREMGLVVATHRETVLHYRRHGGNMTNDAAAGNRDFARMLKASLDRRRRSGHMDVGRHRELE